MEVYNICDVGRIITEKSLALGRGSLFYRKSWFGGSAKTMYCSSKYSFCLLPTWRQGRLPFKVLKGDSLSRSVYCEEINRRADEESAEHSEKVRRHAVRNMVTIEPR